MTAAIHVSDSKGFNSSSVQHNSGALGAIARVEAAMQHLEDRKTSLNKIAHITGSAMNRGYAALLQQIGLPKRYRKRFNELDEIVQHV
jgi:hypothetical protein